MTTREGDDEATISGESFDAGANQVFTCDIETERCHLPLVGWGKNLDGMELASFAVVPLSLTHVRVIGVYRKARR